MELPEETQHTHKIFVLELSIDGNLETSLHATQEDRLKAITEHVKSSMGELNGWAGEDDCHPDGSPNEDAPTYRVEQHLRSGKNKEARAIYFEIAGEYANEWYNFSEQSLTFREYD